MSSTVYIYATDFEASMNCGAFQVQISYKGTSKDPDARYEHVIILASVFHWRSEPVKICDRFSWA